MLELEQIKGVGKAKSERLKKAGFANVEAWAVTPDDEEEEP